jgi:hypothetical protein
MKFGLSMIMCLVDKYYWFIGLKHRFCGLNAAACVPVAC